MVRFDEDERPTRGGRGSVPHLRPVDTVPPEDDGAPVSELVDLGMLMRATQQNTAAVNALSVQVGTLSREVSQHGKTLEDGRGELVAEASHSAAKHTSNRMGALVGALVVIWEIASPYLHQLLHLP